MTEGVRYARVLWSEARGFSIADCFQQLLGSEGLLQERGIDRHMVHLFAGHDDDVHLRVSAASILIEFRA